jgi:hypothetical protein
MAQGRRLGKKGGVGAGVRRSPPLPSDPSRRTEAGPTKKALRASPECGSGAAVPAHSDAGRGGHGRGSAHQGAGMLTSRQGRSCIDLQDLADGEGNLSPEPAGTTVQRSKVDDPMEHDQREQPPQGKTCSNGNLRRQEKQFGPTQRGLGEVSDRQEAGSSRGLTAQIQSPCGEAGRPRSAGAGEGSGSEAPGGVRIASNKRKSPDQGVSPALSAFAPEGAAAAGRKALRRSGFAEEGTSPNRIWGAELYPIGLAKWGGGALSPGAGRRESPKEAKRGWKRSHDRHAAGLQSHSCNQNDSINYLQT